MIVLQEYVTPLTPVRDGEYTPQRNNCVSSESDKHYSPLVPPNLISQPMALITPVKSDNRTFSVVVPTFPISALIGH